MRVCFFVPGEPKGKGRPRFTTRGRCVRPYTPKETADYEDQIKAAALGCEDQEMLMPFWEGPVSVTIMARYGLPKNMTKSERALVAAGVKRPTKKPDADNVAKVVLDALNGVAWADDKQVVYLSVLKTFADDPENVGLKIQVDYGKELSE